MKTQQTIQERLASPEVVSKIRDWLKRNKHESRLALAEHLCKELALKDPRGKLRLAGVQKALRVLEAQGYWRLAKLRGVYGRAGKRGEWRVRWLSRVGCQGVWSK